MSGPTLFEFRPYHKGLKLNLKMTTATPWNNLKTKEVLLRLLEDFENITKELIEGIASVAAQRGPVQQLSSAVTQIFDKIIEKNKEIQDTIRIGEEQIARQHHIVRARDEIAKMDQEILQLQSQLKEAESTLSNALFEAKRKLTVLKEAGRGAISSEDLIKYAFRISSSNSVESPPDWVPGDPRRPYPLDLEMRCGFLGQIMQEEGKMAAPHILNESNAAAQVENKQTEHIETKAESLSDQEGKFFKSSTTAWPSSDLGNPVVYSQIDQMQKEPSYTMISANAVQPREIFNGGQPSTRTDDVEFMSSFSDSSSSESP